MLTCVKQAPKMHVASDMFKGYTRALTLGALCFKFLCVVGLKDRLSNCSRVSANFMSHAGWTKLCKKVDLEF